MACSSCGALHADIDACALRALELRLRLRDVGAGRDAVLVAVLCELERLLVGRRLSSSSRFSASKVAELEIVDRELALPAELRVREVGRAGLRARDSVDSDLTADLPPEVELHEMRPGACSRTRWSATPKPWLPRSGCPTRGRGRAHAEVGAVGYQLLRACQTSVRACRNRASAALRFWLREGPAPPGRSARGRRTGRPPRRPQHVVPRERGPPALSSSLKADVGASGARSPDRPCTPPRDERRGRRERSERSLHGMCASLGVVAPPVSRRFRAPPGARRPGRGSGRDRDRPPASCRASASGSRSGRRRSRCRAAGAARRRRPLPRASGSAPNMRRHRGHHDRPEAQQAGLVDGLLRALALARARRRARSRSS